MANLKCTYFTCKENEDATQCCFGCSKQSDCREACRNSPDKCRLVDEASYSIFLGEFKPLLKPRGAGVR